MRRPAVHILVWVLLLFCLLSCSRKEEKIIPRGKLSRIYEELFLADKWSELKMENREAADTTAFYETILKSYGYTSADYRASVEHYLEDPERFSRILKKASSRLSAKGKELTESADRLQDILNMLDRAKSYAPKFKSISDADLDSILTLFRSDTVRFEMRGKVDAAVPEDTLEEQAIIPAKFKLSE